MTTRVNRLVLVVLLFSVVLIRLPLVTGQGGTVRLVVLLPFVAAAIWAVPRRSADVPLGLIALLALFITTVGIALVRGAQNGVFASPRAAWTDWLTLVVVASFAVLVLSTARTRSERESLLLGVAFAPAVYVAVNAVLWFERAHLPASLLSSTSAAEGKRAQLLGLVGVHATRVNFPLALGVNNFGAIAAAGLAAVTILLGRDRPVSRRVAFAAAAVCLYGVLAADTRGALFAATGAILLFRLVKRIRGSATLGLILPLSPVILIGALSFIASSGLVGMFSRTGDDLITGSNRLYIWGSVFHLLKHPGLDQVFGYGAAGQITSGVSYRYAFVFDGLPDPWTYTTHNLALQTILDTGYFGLVVLAVIVIVSASRLQRELARSNSVPAAAVLAVLIVLIFSGTTEALPTYNFFDTLVLAVLVFAAGITSVATGTAEDDDRFHIAGALHGDPERREYGGTASRR